MEELGELNIGELKEKKAEAVRKMKNIKANTNIDGKEAIREYEAKISEINEEIGERMEELEEKRSTLTDRHNTIEEKYETAVRSQGQTATTERRLYKKMEKVDDELQKVNRKLYRLENSGKIFTDRKCPSCSNKTLYEIDEEESKIDAGGIPVYKCDNCGEEIAGDVLGEAKAEAEAEAQRMADRERRAEGY